MEQNNSQTATRIVLGILALLLISIYAGILFPDYKNYQQLITNGEKIAGTISSKQCNNHGKIFYSFSVDGKIFKNSGSSCTSSCDKSTVGDSVAVIYQNGRPNNSACNLQAIESNLHGNYFLIALLTLILTIGIYVVTSNSAR
jgi:hypothetical protein